MKKFSLLSLLIIVSMILAACGTAAPEATEAPVVEEPAVEEPVAEGSCPLAVEEGAVITFSG